MASTWRSAAPLVGRSFSSSRPLLRRMLSARNHTDDYPFHLAPQPLTLISGPMPDNVDVLMQRCTLLERLVLSLSNYGSRSAQHRRTGVHLARACASAGSSPRLHHALGLSALPAESAADTSGFRRRFAMQSLHVWMLLRRLRLHHDPSREGVDRDEDVEVSAGVVSQELYDSFVEMTDKAASSAIDFMVPGRWAAELERMFYGAALRYDEAIERDGTEKGGGGSERGGLHEGSIDDEDEDALSDALLKNVIGANDQRRDEQKKEGGGGGEAERECARRIARYVRREMKCLELTHVDDLLVGNMRFSFDDKYELFKTPRR